LIPAKVAEYTFKQKEETLIRPSQSTYEAESGGARAIQASASSAFPTSESSIKNVISNYNFSRGFFKFNAYFQLC
jgi:hypothetical protein